MVTPYLTFAGNCREALAFYRDVFESPVELLQTYGDYVPDGMEEAPAALKDWILHAEMKICGTNFWFADEADEPAGTGSMVKLTVSVPDKREAQRIYDGLNRNARVTLPPTETFYSFFHAALIDPYGIGWNIVAEEVTQ